MFESLSRSWALVKASLNVLRADKELIVYPLVSMIAVLVVTLSFFIPLAATGFFRIFTDNEALSFSSIIVLFLLYLVDYTVTFYCTSALVAGALLRLRGGDPTLTYGFQEANKRLPNILGYAMIAATIGVVLQLIRERADSLGQFIIGMAGTAWNIVTFLVVPVLVAENVSPLDAIRRSFELLKKTWGEQIVGNFSINVVFSLILFGVCIVFVLLLVGAISADVPALAILVFLLGTVAILGLLLLSSALNGIYTAALYRYATEGEVDFFDESLIQGAFKPKRG
jgi:hypothetical protein